MKKFLYEHGLSLVLLSLFVLSLYGQSVAGYRQYNEKQKEHFQPAVSYGQYLTEGEFIETVFENWESEFLQLAAFVLLTVFLRQKGSKQSKPLEGEHPSDEDPRLHRNDPDAPWPVRAGGIWLTLYRNSLGLALMFLFVVSFILHGISGAMEYNQEQIEHGQAAIPFMRFFLTSGFWFQSFQNWQSEFLAVATMLILGVFLRQYGSPESKPVHEATGKTGE